MEAKTPEESNKILSKEKLTYKKDLWMYFDSIQEKFFFDRNKAKALLYIISQKNDIDYEYSENLKYLFNQYINQFDEKQEQINSKINNEENTLNKAIKCLIDGLKYESELYLNHTKNISENIIKPLEGFIMNQFDISNEFTGLMKSYEKDFMNTYKILEEKQINFFQGGRSIESAMNNLEILKNQIKKDENNEKGETNEVEENNEDNDNKSEIEENRKEMLDKMTEILEKNRISAKQLQLDYQDYIIKANKNRDKYIELSENLYDKAQHLDEEFIEKIKTNLISLAQNELNLIENIKNNISKTLKISQEINIENEINMFINSKITKFYQPSQFEYLDYNPYLILRNRKGHINALESEISTNIISYLKEAFSFKKPKENLIQEENINFVNETVNDIWEGNDYNKNRLETLFKEHIYRLAFLKMLNQYRVEGIFVLQLKSFQNFCMSLTAILDKSILEKDYECIKLCMILSQTFYLQTEKKMLLQSSMTLNGIWQSKEFWEKMIEFSIWEEINISKEYTVFLNEDGKMRQKRVESAVMSNLITFLFNMKLFGYSEEKSKIVIDEFIKKYNIDGDLIYATNISIKELQDDIITDSIESIINNEIKEDNDLNIKTGETKINNNTESDKDKIEKKEINENNNNDNMIDINNNNNNEQLEETNNTGINTNI